MLESIINTVFSLPYLAIVVTIAAILDIAIHYTKVTTRFTLLQIWGCTMCWPLVLVTLLVGFIYGQSK
jgi:ABC-type tungstate transport system substrate-binding protein